MNASTALDLRLEILDLLAESGAERKELSAAKRLLDKRSDEQIFETLGRMAGYSAITNLEQAEGVLYSLTLTQVAQFITKLKTIDGWD